MSARALTKRLRQKSQRRRAALADSREADRPVRLRNDVLPRLELVERDLRHLLPPTRNVRPSEPAHVRRIVNSVAKLGVCVPVLIDEDDRVIDGLATVEAARQIGLESVPCIVVSHLSPAERRLLRIALNRLQEKGRWDLGELKSSSRSSSSRMFRSRSRASPRSRSRSRSTRSCWTRSPVRLRTPARARSGA